MPKRKFVSEFGLHSFANVHALARFDDLDQLFHLYGADSPDFHIYMITSRPRISFAPDSLKFTSSHIAGAIRIQSQEAFELRPFEVRHRFSAIPKRVEHVYPYADIKLYDDADIMIWNANAGMALTKMGGEFRDLLRLEVEYVGQAYGKGGERTAQMRLNSHETLQRVYSEVVRSRPDREVWLVLTAYEEQMVASFDGTQPTVESNDSDERHRIRAVSEPPTEQQWLNFTEAALIKYFMPRYNSTFKGKFPNPAHESYRECYDLDINAIIIEVNTECIIHQLYSGAAPANWTHFAEFDLHSREERQSMLSFPEGTSARFSSG